jgi:hypothetical protein
MRVTSDGRSRSAAVICVPISAPSTETTKFSGIERVGLDLDGGRVGGDEGARCGVALDDDVDLDGDALALVQDEEVGVLDAATDRVHDDRLGQCQLRLAGDVEGEHSVGAVVTQHGSECAGVECQVLRVGCVSVQNGGNEAVATSAACGTLAEFGADLCGEVVYLRCHGATCS